MYLNEKALIEEIKLEGVENIIFNIPMRQVHSFMGVIGFSTSSDEEVIVPCKINTEMYDPMEGYKIEIESMINGFGRKSFYASDFASLIRKGTFSIRGYKIASEQRGDMKCS